MEVPVLLDVLDNLPKKMWDWYGFEMVRYEGSKFGPTFLCIGKSVRGTMYAVAMNITPNSWKTTFTTLEPVIDALILNNNIWGTLDYNVLSY